MPFNRWTYYANKYERQARAYIELARRRRASGDYEIARMYVRLARSTWRSARCFRLTASL